MDLHRGYGLGRYHLVQGCHMASSPSGHIGAAPVGPAGLRSRSPVVLIVPGAITASLRILLALWQFLNPGIVQGWAFVKGVCDGTLWPILAPASGR